MFHRDQCPVAGIPVVGNIGQPGSKLRNKAYHRQTQYSSNPGTAICTGLLSCYSPREHEFGCPCSRHRRNTICAANLLNHKKVSALVMVSQNHYSPLKLFPVLLAYREPFTHLETVRAISQSTNSKSSLRERHIRSSSRPLSVQC